MPRPLELSYNWRGPLVITTVGMVVFVALLARSQAVGWSSAAAVLVGCWAILIVVVRLRTRAYLLVDGPMLVVRRFRTFHHIEGAQVVAVKEFLTPSGPSYTLVCRTPDGRATRRTVPTALLRGGHATLFTWILTWAPHAELDRRSRRTLDELHHRGLVE